MESESFRKDLLKKWHKRICFLSWCFFAAILLVEVGMALLKMFYLNNISPSVRGYFWGWVIKPSLINLAACIINTFVTYSKRVTLKTKNAISCLTLLVLATVVSTYHNYFALVLILPCVPVLISAIFSSRRLTVGTTTLSLVCMILSMTTWLKNYPSADQSLGVATCIIAAFILAGSFAFALIIMQFQQEQITYIYSSFRRQQQLIEELNIEPMTRLYNKTACSECIRLYIKKFQNGECVPHLVLIDIDNFKQVNDTYGHSSGDEVLLYLSDLIHDRMKGSRRAFRFGGDEFVLLFDSDSTEKINQMVESLREDFANATFSFKLKKPVTFSAGIAACKEGLDEKSWFDLVDSTMYKSKEQGRNQTFTA